MLKRILVAFVGLLFCVCSSFANAQVADKILMQAVSWMLQKQIDEWEKANDPNRPLKEFDAQDRFDSRDMYAPRESSRFQNSLPNQGLGRGDDTVRPVSVPAVE
jgi:hypothetical protein